MMMRLGRLAAAAAATTTAKPGGVARSCFRGVGD